MIELSANTSFENIEKIIFDNEKISLTKETVKQINDCFDFLAEFEKGNIIYGINTGFGPMAQYRVDDKFLKNLQYNIIRSHSAGAGEPLPDLYVRGALLARLGTFLQAHSGINIEMPNLIMEFLNRGIYPFIPEHGSVGASGDLVQLAQIGLTLIGEGKVHYHGEWLPTSEVMKKEGLKPMGIHIREGLSITNGTSVMTGIGLVNLIYAKRLFDWSLLSSSMMNEIATSYDDFASETLNSLKHHEGQIKVAKFMRELLKGSKCTRNREDELYHDHVGDAKTFKTKVQPYYSLRCVPQVLGPVYDTIKFSAKTLTDELSSACDNPIVAPEDHTIYHGGNFHGDYVSLEMDKLKISITKLTMLAERQINYLYHDRINNILPPFVNMGVIGLNYGMQGVQFTATSTTAECQTLSNSMYVHSIPNNNDNQDIVSMGTNSALLARKVIDNGYQVMAIHFMSLVQAVDCLKAADKLSPESHKIYNEIREFFPLFIEDTTKYEDIARMEEYLRTRVLHYSDL